MSGRNWCFTINNYTDDDLDAIESWDFNYLIFGREVGEKGTPHLQGYIELGKVARLSGMKKMHDTAHWELRRGTQQQAIDYCKKDNDWQEIGEKANQGKRNDLEALKEEIMNGKSVDEILLENPMAYHQYGRTLKKLEDLRMRKVWRTEMTTCEWIVGPTGSGKSHMAYGGDYQPDKHYVWKNDHDWQEGYQQQPIVVINDFRGENIPYEQLLQMVDKWPYWLSRRGEEPRPFTSKHIVITSPLTPEEAYPAKAKSKDSINQLLRRVTVKRLSVTEVVGGNTKPLPEW